MKRIYSSYYKKVRNIVKKRDNYTCQYPNCSSKKIEVHHILRHANFPRLRDSEKNLICLCNKHHKQVTKKEEIYAPILSNIVSRKYQ